MTQWVKCDDGTIIMQKKIKFFGVMRIEPEIVCAGWLEENVHVSTKEQVIGRLACHCGLCL